MIDLAFTYLERKGVIASHPPMRVIVHYWNGEQQQHQPAARMVVVALNSNHLLVLEWCRRLKKEGEGGGERIFNLWHFPIQCRCFWAAPLCSWWLMDGIYLNLSPYMSRPSYWIYNSRFSLGLASGRDDRQMMITRQRLSFIECREEPELLRCVLWMIKEEQPVDPMESKFTHFFKSPPIKQT